MSRIQSLALAAFAAGAAALAADVPWVFQGDTAREPAASVSATTGAERSFSWNALADWPDHTVEEATVRVTAWAPLAPPDYRPSICAQTPNRRVAASRLIGKTNEEESLQ